MKTLKELKAFIILWLTQSFSSLGSSMTNFALVIWLYQRSGSALTTSLLTVCSYAPYVIMSIFAGAISDKWNKKAVMLVCDSFAALCTVATLILLKAGALEVWHLYILNALNGLMNSVQSPASDVAATFLTPEKHYQKTSGMRSFSNSLVSILTPVFAAAVISFAGIEAVIAFDLITFFTAFLVLLFFIRIPEAKQSSERGETLLQSAKIGLVYLRANKGILWLILFLSAINLIASMHNATLPAMILSKKDETALGAVSSCVGIVTLLGSVVATFFPKPKSRINVICNCLLISMSTENFLLAFGNNTVVWCIGAVLGWLVIPLMSANYDVIFRSNVPKELQGRVYSVRNTLQFFTIPVGYFLGGILVDKVFEPFMESVKSELLTAAFGSGKGSGAAFLFFVMGVAGMLVCLIFRRIKALRALE
ncbi:MAG: MFS transporter [Oscillospiraceae bacterium]|nr:MFS transporter [Oscillospiraceae bacterium]